MFISFFPSPPLYRSLSPHIMCFAVAFWITSLLLRSKVLFLTLFLTYFCWNQWLPFTIYNPSSASGVFYTPYPSKFSIRIFLLPSQVFRYLPLSVGRHFSQKPCNFLPLGIVIWYHPPWGLIFHSWYFTWLTVPFLQRFWTHVTWELLLFFSH